jgi:hypothetical protein
MNPIPVRVMVLDVWDEIRLDLAPTVSVRDLKAKALEAAWVRRPADQYLVKFRGAELAEGDQTIGDAGVVANAGLIVLARARSPVR